MEVAQVVGELPPPVVADVHGGRRRLGTCEQSPLRLEVLLHRPVQVEVVLAQVREDERVEAHAVEAPQRRPVRARLERGAAVAGVEHLAEEPLQVDRLGRRERRRSRLTPHPPLDRPDEPGPATCSVQDRPQQERRRRLPVRPGRARDLELLRRLAEEHVRRDRHRLAHGRARGAAGRRPRAAAPRRRRPRRARSPPTRGRARPPARRGRRRRARRPRRAACRTRGR